MPPKRRTVRKPAPREPEVYTYQNGKKVLLNKSPTDFVVRARPESLMRLGFPGGERLSSASFRFAVAPADLSEAMTRAREEVTAHHAYTRQETGDDFLITDRLLVRFREGVAEQAQTSLAGKYGLFLVERVGPRDCLYQLTDHTEMNPVKLVVQLTEAEKDLVEYAEHDLNRMMEPSNLALPVDPSYLGEWHLHRSLQNSDFDPRASARCEEAWQLLTHFGSPDVVIGITDDGCRMDHPDFAASKFAGWGYLQGSDLITDRSPGADTSRMYQSDANHGTSCCGVAAGEVNGQLTVGAAPGARLFPIKWETVNRRLMISDSKLLRVLNYVADKVDILSNSWASTPSSVWSVAVIEKLQTLAKTGGRRGKGILFLFAAGNWNCPLNHSGAVAIPYTSGWSFDAVGTPLWVGVKVSTSFSNNTVGIDGVLHVAALASTATRSHYSCYGEGISLCAPSSNSHMYQRNPVRGLGITAATGLAALTRSDFGGTSSATPLVAGIAALVISANPNLSALDIAGILRRTASKDLDFSSYPKTEPANFDNNPAWDVSPVTPHETGMFRDRGLPDGTWSPWYGHGLVDARAAVAAALAQAPAAAASVFTSKPGILIPDNDAAGVQDPLTVDQEGALLGIEVSVNITHTWIGDLRAALVSPGGVEVVLHDRTGSSTHDLNATFSTQTTPGLEGLRNQPANGVWRLTVRDLARFDSGRLVQWSLALRIAPAPRVFTDEAAVTIPDAPGEGLVRQVILPAGMRPQDIGVRAEISHPSLDQLSLELAPPGRAPVLLAAAGSLSGDSLQRTWKVSEGALPHDLLASDLSGMWRLAVRDVAGGVTGKLNRWSVEVLTA